MTSLGVFPANERVSMSLDDRIRQLSETIIQEARGPIESALHHLLADVMTLAASERDQAVQAALAEASAAHESALAALREEHERNRVDVDALRAQFEREQDAGLTAAQRRSSSGSRTAGAPAACGPPRVAEQERDAALGRPPRAARAGPGRRARVAAGVAGARPRGRAQGRPRGRRRGSRSRAPIRDRGARAEGGRRPRRRGAGRPGRTGRP